MLSVLTGIIASGAAGQDFPGYRTGNYAGVNSVFFNPASIADSRYYIDVNLLSASTLAANDQASFRFKDITRTFNGDSISTHLFGRHDGTASGMFSIDVHGPSAMFAVGKGGALAFTTRARMFSNAARIDGKLFSQLRDENPADPDLPYSFAPGGPMQFSAHAWMEFGASYARVLLNTGAHVLKGGLTLKFLGGTANGFLQATSLRGRLATTERVFFEETTGRIQTGFSGTRISGFEARHLTTINSSGFGTDLGFVYEFRPEGAMQTVDGIKLDNDYQNTYRLRLGLALLDLGSIAYRRDPVRSGTHDLGITDGKQLFLRELVLLDPEDYAAFFASRPDIATPVSGSAAEEYNVSLPSTLQIDADLLIYDGWYLNLAGQVGLSSNTSKLHNNRPYSSITFTPRFESRLIGAYLPVNVNSLSRVNAGLAFRAGPLFFGSGSLLTSLMGSSRQADFYFGLRFGELR